MAARTPKFWLVALLCGSSCAPKPALPSCEPPKEIEHEVLVSEQAALAAQAAVESALAVGLGAEDAGAWRLAFAPDFLARAPKPERAQRLPDDTLVLDALRSDPAAPWLPLAGFLQCLREWLGPYQRLLRVDFETDRFFLARDHTFASGQAELFVGVEHEQSRRLSLRARCAVAFRHGAQGWQLSALDLLQGLRIESPAPPYEEVSQLTGFDERLSSENRALFQSFVDQHRTLAHGGLSALDWNGDQLPDLLATRQAQMATLFLNDGRGGFVPEPLPLTTPSQAPTSFLWLDLDGDGLEELVGASVLWSRADQAGLGLWSRRAGTWQLVEEALSFSIERGERRLAVQTIVPCDVDADQRIDLFVGIYGSERSRGPDYNTIEAHDGADNLLFLNQGGLNFVEASAARGIHGRQYTYVAFAFDFDGDGDEDLWEGNDFGPNVLWQNDGRGFFAADPSSVFAGDSSYTMGVTLADYDNEGRFHLYVSNMSAEAGSRIAAIAEPLDAAMRQRVWDIAAGNALYRQSADRKSWERISAAAAAWEGEWAWGSVFFDADNDGDQEIYVTNGFASHKQAELPDWDSHYWRQVVADGAALMRGERSQDVNAADPFEGSYSGYQHDRLYYNPAGKQDFVEAAWHFGLAATHDGRSIVPVDFDGDGDLDLALWTLQGLRLYRRNAPPASFARLRLKATNSEAQALGAVVSLRAGALLVRERVRCVEGFQSQLLREIHCGLGAHERIDALRVEWPSGKVEEWTDLPARKLLWLEEGRAPRVSALTGWGELWLPSLEECERLWSEIPSANKGTPLALQLDPEAADSMLPKMQAGCTFLRSRAGSMQATLLYDQEGRLLRAFSGQAPLDAIERILAAARSEPTFPDLLAETARRELRQGRLRPALQYLERALAQDPELEWAWEARGRTHVALQRPDLAEEDYARAVAADPDYALGWYNLGVVRAQLGQPAQALPALQEAVAIAPENVQYLLALGESAARAREPAQALDALQRAATVDPTLAEPLVLAAKLHAQMGRPDLAQACIEQALAREPNHPEALRVAGALQSTRAR